MSIIISASFKRMMKELYEQSKIAEAIIDLHGGIHITSDEVDYLTMRNGLMSFLPAGKEHLVNDDGTWRRENRQEGKPARVIRKVITDAVTTHFSLVDADYEKFSNLVASYCSVNGDDDRPPTIAIVVANGDLIHEIYNGNSDEAGGNLSGSCMRGKDVFDMYTDNPDKVNIIAAIDERHRVVGRALLWHADDGRKYMDTIYAADHLQQLFINFAIEKEFYYKSSQSCHWHEFDRWKGNQVRSSNVCVTLDDSSYREYPYMDTMRYLNTDTGELTNYEPTCAEYYLLRCTDGGYEEVSCYEDDVYNGGRVHRDDAFHIDYERPIGRWICGYVNSDDLVQTRNGDYILSEDSVVVNGRVYITNDDNIVELDNGDYAHIDDIEYDLNGNPILADDAVEIVVNDVSLYAHIDECKLINGRWYHESQFIKDGDGKPYIIGQSSRFNP